MPERVVLIHAGIADSRMWDRQATLLSNRGFEVVAPDLPGFGSESVPAEPYSFVESFARLLPATAIGNSFGGQVALATALSNPKTVNRLVLVAPAIDDHDWSEDMRSYWRHENELLERGDLDAATELTLEVFAQPEVHAVLRPMQRGAYELQLAGNDPEVTWPEKKPLTSLEPPTLVIVGEDDRPDFHAIAERIVREAPSARLEVISGARHVPSLEAPDEFERLLIDFLEHGV
jgi:pimeloyl-ACP methyl ester carboxylesterase